MQSSIRSDDAGVGKDIIMREYVITTDNNADLPDSFYEKHGIGCTWFSYTREGKHYSHENFMPVGEFYRKMREGSMPTTAQVNPAEVRNLFEPYLKEGKDILHIAFSSGLSGTYNSALQGKMLYEEEFGDDKKIIVFDSLATSGIETIVAKKIKELADGGKNAEDIQKEIDAYIVNNTGLYFCLESLDALKSNGRLFALAAKVLEKIRVKLICKRTDQGNISLVAQDITLNRAMMKMSNLIAGELDGKDLSGETLVVSYVCCEDRAKQVAAKICEKAKFGNVEILKASGLNSLYASDGGIIVSYSF